MLQKIFDFLSDLFGQSNTTASPYERQIPRESCTTASPYKRQTAKEFMGMIGEKSVYFDVRTAARFQGQNMKFLSNVYVPKKNGETSEIDLIAVTPKGLLVIESKNYSGWIFGNEQNMYWTVTYRDGQRHRIYSPVRQNRNHILALLSYLGKNVPVYSMIVFSNKGKLKNVSVHKEGLWVIQEYEVYPVMRYIKENIPDCLTAQQIEEIYQKLLPLTNVDDTVRQTHKEDIKQKFGADAPLVCPICGDRLVLRRARSGVYAGDLFYGCSNYPRCRYIRDLK